MANKVITGKRDIATSDYLDSVKFVGKTKGGDAVKIEVFNAINLENISWELKEKSEVIQAVTFQGTYEDSDLESGNYDEPFKITYPGTTGGSRDASSIVLGEGKFYINDTYVGLTRDGGTFSVERTYRNITADGDPGPVKDRIMKDEGKPTLAVSMLQILGNIDKIYPAMSIADAPSSVAPSNGN